MGPHCAEDPRSPRCSAALAMAWWPRAWEGASPVGGHWALDTILSTVRTAAGAWAIYRLLVPHTQSGDSEKVAPGLPLGLVLAGACVTG